MQHGISAAEILGGDDHPESAVVKQGHGGHADLREHPLGTAAREIDHALLNLGIGISEGEEGVAALKIEDLGGAPVAALGMGRRACRPRRGSPPCDAAEGPVDSIAHALHGISHLEETILKRLLMRRSCASGRRENRSGDLELGAVSVHQELLDGKGNLAKSRCQRSMVEALVASGTVSAISLSMVKLAKLSLGAVWAS
jgi:hypothetical protein